MVTQQQKTKSSSIEFNAIQLLDTQAMYKAEVFGFKSVCQGLVTLAEAKRA